MGTRLSTHTANALLLLRNRHFFLVDVCLLLLIPALALWLRTDDAFVNPQYDRPLLVYTLISLPIWLGVFIFIRLYSRNWLYASVEEMGVILKGILIGAVLTTVVTFLVLRPTGWISGDFPRSIPFLAALLTLIMVGGTRFSVRLMEQLRRQRQFAGRSHRHVVVIGAGEVGVMMVREMQRNPDLGLNPVALLDDDKRKYNTLIMGVPVVGATSDVDKVVRSLHVHHAVIAIPSAPGKTIREIAARCLENNMTVQTVPAMSELLNGSVTVTKLRNVEIEDLLRRDPVAAEPEVVQQLLHGKRVLVTGAGGSIGGELCRQIARCEPAQLILLGHGENSVFNQANELRALFPELPIESVIADVRDTPRIHTVLARYRPQHVFHAAAHKHVSLMESNVPDAVTNNVLGTRVVVDACIANEVDSFVMISSDKAVNPMSVMGATKRVAELYVHARALETGKKLVAVRFGNVLGSRGSVVPLFKQQIASGGPVLVTDPEVRRFFMTIPEAVQLVLQAATLGRGGEIFALDMGEPIRIVDLARDMIRLSGLQEGRDIDIEFIGLRPGEKMYEEVFIPGETYQRTVREKIFVARNGTKPSADENAALYRSIDGLIQCAQTGQDQQVRAQLGAIVPEYSANLKPALEALPQPQKPS